MKLSELYTWVENLSQGQGGTTFTQQEWYQHLRAQSKTFPNLYQELEMDSRFVEAQEDVSRAREEVQLHSHAFYELLYIQDGNVQYLLGERRYRLQRGDVVVVPPGKSHRPLFLEALTAPYHRYVVWLSRKFVDQLAENFPELALLHRSEGLFRTAGTPWEEPLRGLFQSICADALQKNWGWPALVYGDALRLLVCLQSALADCGGVAPAVEKCELLDEVLAYIEQCFAQKITLEQTARRFLVSESTISQLFHHKMGVSFYRCVTQRRLIAAKSKILAGERLEDLCHQIGFQDYSTFYRAFKREYGISPRQFRKLQEPKALDGE